MIAIQVAAGIVLAYVLIVNQRALLRAAGWCLSVLIGIGILIGVGWGGSTAIGVVSSHWPAIWGKIGMAIFMIVWFAMLGAGGYGLIRIVRAVFKTDRPRLEGDGSGPLFIVGGFAFLNAALVYAISWPLLSYTAIGSWYDAADLWSRTNGHADGVSMLIAGIAYLWSLPIVWLIERFRTAPATGDHLDPVSSQLPSV